MEPEKESFGWQGFGQKLMATGTVTVYVIASLMTIVTVWYFTDRAIGQVVKHDEEQKKRDDATVKAIDNFKELTDAHYKKQEELNNEQSYILLQDPDKRREIAKQMMMPASLRSKLDHK